MRYCYEKVTDKNIFHMLPNPPTALITGNCALKGTDEGSLILPVKVLVFWYANQGSEMKRGSPIQRTFTVGSNKERQCTNLSL